MDVGGRRGRECDRHQRGRWQRDGSPAVHLRATADDERPAPTGINPDQWADNGWNGGHHHREWLRHQPGESDDRRLRHDAGDRGDRFQLDNDHGQKSPPHAVGAVPVTVADAGGVATAAQQFTYTNQAVTVTGINPAFGPTTGGTSVTITGTRIRHRLHRHLRGRPATVTTIAPTQIIATDPAHAAARLTPS